jgi:N-acetylglucosaminyldiphosphoundecaprenol N-acetyl-beta-D-mannosaminyltransferase
MSDSCLQVLPPRLRIGRISVSATTMEEALDLLDRRLRQRQPAYVCIANVDAAVLSLTDRELRRIENESLFTVPDSMPLIWYARLVGNRRFHRVTGPDLMMEVLKASVPRGYTHYFYGDTEETLQKLRRAAQNRFPGVRILGTHSPPFRPPTAEEEQATIDEINRLEPSFVWVALGCPKQERWAGRVFPRIKSSIVVPVGAAFRFFIGEYRHAPRLMQLCGLEGIYWRGFQHPFESLKWYGYRGPIFAAMLLGALGKRLVKPISTDS